MMTPGLLWFACVLLADYPPQAVVGAGLSPAERPPDTVLAWKVDSLPILELGRSDGEVTFLSISTASRLSDGTLVVGDMALSEVHLFGENGTHLGTIGGKGDGPGEFQMIGDLFADSEGRVNVFDRNHQRISRFSADGHLMSDQRLSGLQSPMGKVGQFADGGRFARTRNRLVPVPINGVSRDTVSYFSLSPNGAVGDLLAKVPGPISTMVMVSGQASMRYVLFSPIPYESTNGNCLYLTQGDLPGIEIVHESGKVVDRVSLDVQRRRVRGEHRRQWIESTLEQLGAQPGSRESAMVEELGSRIQTAEWLPHFADLVIDELGYIWLQEYSLPFGQGREWMVLEGTGELLGRIVFPRVFHVLHIAENTIVGVFTNESGEELIHVYSLTRGRDTRLSELPIECR